MKEFLQEDVRDRWGPLVADFFRFYGVHPDDIFDMGFHAFLVSLLGLGEDSAWHRDRMKDKEKDKTDNSKAANREAAAAASKVTRANTDTELNNQMAHVSHILRML